MFILLYLLVLGEGGACALRAHPVDQPLEVYVILFSCPTSILLPLTSIVSQHSCLIRCVRYCLAKFSNSIASRICKKATQSLMTKQNGKLIKFSACVLGRVQCSSITCSERKCWTIHKS